MLPALGCQGGAPAVALQLVPLCPLRTATMIIPQQTMCSGWTQDLTAANTVA